MTESADVSTSYVDDRDLQKAAFYSVIAATDQPVGWAYGGRDEDVSNLSQRTTTTGHRLSPAAVLPT